MDKGTTLIHDTLIVKDGETFAVYSPFTGQIARVKRFPREGGPLFDNLASRGFFKLIPETTKRDNTWDGFNSLTLLLTRSCNFGCTYCYAFAAPGGESMRPDFAVSAFRWYVNQLKRSKIRVSFHGGGEPTLEAETIRLVVKEAKKLAASTSKKLEFQITTNGSAPEIFTKWMIEEKFNISISMDGPPEVQNRTRPLACGNESSAIVEKTIRLLVAREYPFTIRVTYSPKHDIISTVEYFATLGVKKLHLEPLFPFGREYNLVRFGQKSGYEIYPPAGKDILENFLKAVQTCEKFGITIFNSHFHQFTAGIGYFCGSASGRSMVVTHDGFLSGCLEVVDGEDKDMRVFNTGRWIPEENRFSVDIAKINMFQARHAEALPECKSCFARYTCAGGCAVKAVRASGNFFDRDLPYCGFTRGLVPILVRKIATASGV